MIESSYGSPQLGHFHQVHIFSVINMQWVEFLDDHDLNTNQVHSPPNGAYLFRKVIHDVRECLTAYRESVHLVSSMPSALPIETYKCLSKWVSTVETWGTKLTDLVKLNSNYLPASPQWAELIAAIGEVIAEAPSFHDEMETLAQPTDAAVEKMVRIATYSAAKLHLLWGDIHAQEYKRLWTTLHYGDFVEGHSHK
jgi:hypothetical protein